MNAEKTSTLYNFNVICCLIISLLLISCKPSKDSRDPRNYELYISKSSDKYPAISPDGSSIAYYHQNLEEVSPIDYPTGLFVIDADGNNRRLLIKGDNYSPSWSPEGKWLVFTSNGVIKIINLDGNILRTFDGVNEVPLFFPDWSSDGNMILMSSPYVVGGGVYISTPLLEKARQLFDSQVYSGFGARWSHNMDKIIYEKVSHDWAGGEIFILDTLGLNDSRVTNDNIDDRYPVLSNTNEMIAWSRDVQITIMKTDGTARKRLDYGQNPSWGPNSDFLVYSYANQDFTKEVLWKIKIDGSNKVQLTY